MRPTLTCLALAALFVLTPVVAPRTAADDRDEQEARSLAVRFMKRLRETGDFQPLVSEFFPEDFAARLRMFAREQSPDSELFHICKREVLLRADDADLRRAYVVLMNLWEQQQRLGDAAWQQAKLEDIIAGNATKKGEGDVWARHLKLTEESVPEEAFRIAETDPLLKATLDLVRPRGPEVPAAGGAQADEEEVLKAAEAKLRSAVVRDLARLRALTDKFERCVALLRGAVARLRAQTESLAAAHSVSMESLEDGRARDEFHVYKLESETLEEETFSLPAGSVLIRARIYPYEMAVARVRGRLTILAVYPDLDGD